MSASDNPRRCVLFVPGVRPERFQKALAADPDQVCIDLEDAVAAGDKQIARTHVMAFLDGRRWNRSEVGVRINPINSDEGRRDLQMLVAVAVAPDFIMLPKVESIDDLIAAEQLLGARPTPLIAQIESPRAVFDARRIASARNRLQALMFGGYDYAVALRGQPGWETFYPARTQLAMVAAEADIGFIDVPWLGIRDLDDLARETDAVIALGATARAAIHPDQVSVIQQRFLPSLEQIENAVRVQAAMQAANGEAIQLDGKLVDRPIQLAAERCLALARFGTRSD